MRVYRSQRRWSDRVKQLDLPIFPGYLFCRLDVQDRLLPVLSTPAVISIVGAGKKPIPVAEEEISSIRAILQSGLAAQPWPFLDVGSRVYIEAGPLASLEGIMVLSAFRLPPRPVLSVCSPIRSRISTEPFSLAGRASDCL